jgi:hypothetical protein
MQMQQPAQAYVPPRLPSPRDHAPAMVARGQKDEAAPAVRIPAPEELGIGTQKIVHGDGPLDWAMVERKLDRSGVTGFQIEKTEAGYRFTCQLPTGPVTGRGATKAEAVRSALVQLP